MYDVPALVSGVQNLYRRSVTDVNDLYVLGFVCVSACQCNGHSTCVDRSVCEQCQNLTTGPQCETCKPGYYGDPTNGGKCEGTNVKVHVVPKSNVHNPFRPFRVTGPHRSQVKRDEAFSCGNK